ncbi:MAG: hypothetical protein F6K42_16260 [Leptolyngbya sp. SIO1D8]|nr:hypothetical protein [Leptolyngbya sp. SIO1D8]
MMKPVLTLGLCLSLSIVEAFLVAPAIAQSAFANCLNTANSLFIDNSLSEIAAIRACQGTTQPQDVSECISLVDALWVDDSASEIAGLETCQFQQQQLFETDSNTVQAGAYATCLLQASQSTRDQSLAELASIRACRGLTQPEEVSACLSLVEYLWLDESDAELLGLSACRVPTY